MQAIKPLDMDALNNCTVHYEGGDCTKQLYKPQRERLKEPVYVCLPTLLGRTPSHVQARCHGKDVIIPVPQGCSAGAKLELRLDDKKDTVSVRSVPWGDATADMVSDSVRRQT